MKSDIERLVESMNLELKKIPKVKQIVYKIVCYPDYKANQEAYTPTKKKIVETLKYHPKI